MHFMLSAAHPFQHGCSIHCIFGFLQYQPVYLYHLQGPLCAEAFDNGAGTTGVDDLGFLTVSAPITRSGILPSCRAAFATSSALHLAVSLA